MALSSPRVPSRRAPLHVAVSGLIGAGKTEFAKALAPLLGVPLYEEPVIDNKHLMRFYDNMRQHSFALQMYLLGERFRQQQQVIWNLEGGVQDRSIYEDQIFAKMLVESNLMDELDYHTYLNLFQSMSNFMKRPNLIVHLDVSPEEAFFRIHELRKRKMESGITIEYLRALNAGYQEFLQDISGTIPVIRVPWHDFNADVTVVAQKVVDEYKQMKSIRTVSLQ